MQTRPYRPYTSCRMKPAWLVEIWERRKLELGLICTGLMLVGLGVWWWKIGGIQETKVEVLGSETMNQEATIGEKGKQLVVDIEGAVVKPGVYTMPAAARLYELIDEAGGMASDADRGYVEQQMNQSEILRDGMKVFIPRIEIQDNEASYKVGAGNVKNNSGLIDINSATTAQLDTLSGIGPVTAEKIISGRPYTKIEELIEKKIVGQKVWGQIKDKISAW